MKHVGKSIEKFRKIQKVSVLVIAKETGIKKELLDDFLNGKSMLNKKQKTAILKCIDISPEIILMDALEVKDVAKDKQDVFKSLSGLAKKLAVDIHKDNKKKPAKKNGKK